jgi:hypothetical protein
MCSLMHKLFKAVQMEPSCPRLSDEDYEQVYDEILRCIE